MVGLLFSVVVALVSHNATTHAHAAATNRASNFPTAGVVIPGQTIGGIALGMTETQVKQRWGPNFTVCGNCGGQLTWLYVYPGGDAALGAAVKFSAPSGSTGTSNLTAAAKIASASALAAAKKATTAQAKATAAAASAASAAAKAAAAKAAAAKAKAARAANMAGLAASANRAGALASKTKITAAKDASLARAAVAAAAQAKAAATKANTAVAAAATAASEGNVTAVFTLGSPVGWGLKGVEMGDPVTNVYNLYGNPADINCIGYGALTVRAGNSTTAFYTANGVIYGFALTAPSQSPCQ